MESQGHKAQKAPPVSLEVLDHKDFLGTVAEMDPKVLPEPAGSTGTQERWGDQVVKVTEVSRGLVVSLVQMECQDQEELKVLKENQVHLDQGPKGFKERRGIQGVLELQVRRGNLGIQGAKVFQDPVVSVAPKENQEPQDAEVLLEILVKKVVMVLQVQMALQDPLASRETRVLLEILVQQVQEETRDRMEYLDLLEKKEQWELLELDPGAQRGRKVHLAVLGRRVLRDHVALRGPVVLQDSQVVRVLLDLLVLLVFLVWRESALKESKEKMASKEHKDPKVLQDVAVLLVLQVLDSKETKDSKVPEVNRGRLAALVTLVHEA